MDDITVLREVRKLGRSVTMDDITVLREVRKLLDDPKRWIKGSLAVNSMENRPVPPWFSSADCFCMSGALCKIVGPYDGVFIREQDIQRNRVEKIILNNTPRWICDFTQVQWNHSWDDSIEVPGLNDNESVTHDMILEILDTAIANA